MNIVYILFKNLFFFKMENLQCIVVTNHSDALYYLDNIAKQNVTVLGFDTETTVIFKDNSKRVSIIQLSTNQVCYIFQMNKILDINGKLPSKLISFIQSPEIIKIGVDLNNDITNLQAYNLTLRGSIDIQSIAISLGYPKLSLFYLCKTYLSNELGCQKDVYDLRADWDNDLSTDQISYAAKDAYLPLILYQKIMKIDSPSSISKIEIDLDREKNEYKLWLFNILDIPYKMNSLINRTANSYSKWTKCYQIHERKIKSQQYIKYWIDSGELIVDSKNMVSLC